MNAEAYIPVAVTVGEICWNHLRYTSPGNLFDDELDRWGYEPHWADEQFVKECRCAVNNPTEILHVGDGRYLIVLTFPSAHHAQAVLCKLEKEGFLRASNYTGFDAEIKEEGRAFLVGAARGFEQLRQQGFNRTTRKAGE